jgi:hypothetical protein
MGWACSPQWSRPRPNTFTKPSQPASELPGSPPPPQHQKARPLERAWSRERAGMSHKNIESRGYAPKKIPRSPRNISAPRTKTAPGASFEAPSMPEGSGSGNGRVSKPRQIVRRCIGSAESPRNSSRERLRKYTAGIFTTNTRAPCMGFPGDKRGLLPLVTFGLSMPKPNGYGPMNISSASP